MFSVMLPLLHTFAAGCKTDFLGLIPWYEYLEVDQTDCHIKSFDDSSAILGAHSPLLLIGLAILEDLIRIAAMVAVGYIVYGGFQYLTSQGAPDSTKKAQQTIINALVGVAIAIIAASGIGYLGHRLGS